MNKNTRTIVDVCWYLVCFLLIQTVCTSIAMLVSPNHVLNQLSISLCLLASSVITIALYWQRKWWVEKKEYFKKISIYVYSALFFIAVASFIPSLALMELLDIESNEQQERILMDVISSPFGFLIIALLVPISEEIVFRGAFLRTLLNYFQQSSATSENVKQPSNTKYIWLSIIISSVAFGLVHGNLPQFLHATLLGILLGWVYTNTRSIWPGVFFHLLNNAITFLIIKLYPNMNDASFSDLYGGDSFKMYMNLATFLFVICFAIYRLNKIFCLKNDDNQKE